MKISRRSLLASNSKIGAAIGAFPIPSVNTIVSGEVM
jgi:hypothetical protein